MRTRLESGGFAVYPCNQGDMSPIELVQLSATNLAYEHKNTEYDCRTSGPNFARSSSAALKGSDDDPNNTAWITRE